MSWALSTVGQLLKGLQSPFPWRRRVALWRDVVPAHTPDVERACGSLSDNKFPVHQQESFNNEPGIDHSEPDSRAGLAVSQELIPVGAGASLCPCLRGRIQPGLPRWP